ncbi:hypothetical protein [Streptomyces sp. NPDC005407]|uniref:hypothetical protein n=1 Tax=Streptomyces sp. NPDC005407 TaxID=3155340 RepID=UPI0033B8D3F4
MTLPPEPHATVTARLPDGRHLIAHIDPTTPEHHSPLQRALRAADIPPPPKAVEDRGIAARTNP